MFVSADHWLRHWKNKKSLKGEIAELEQGKEPRQGHYWWEQKRWSRDYDDPVQLNIRKSRIFQVIEG